MVEALNELDGVTLHAFSSTATSINWNGRQVRRTHDPLLQNIEKSFSTTPELCADLGKQFSSVQEIPFKRKESFGKEFNLKLISDVLQSKPSSSCHYKTEGTRLPHLQIGFINGIKTPFAGSCSFVSHLKYIQKFSGDLSIDGVYNYSYGAVLDILEMFFVDLLTTFKTKDLLLENWIQFDENNKDNPDAKYLQLTHSMGTLIAKSALTLAPPHIKDRVVIVAFGSPVILDENACYHSVHYSSEKDVVHLGQFMLLQLYSSSCSSASQTEVLKYIESCKKRLILLKPSLQAKGIDHDFEGDTFATELSRQIKKYIDHNGQYKKDL